MGILLTESQEKELDRLARAHAPNEAVGLILPEGKIVSLVNREVDSPTTRFRVDKADILQVLTDGGQLELPQDQLVLWHSHPGGGVGPSRIDMTHKSPIRYNLVVTPQLNTDETGSLFTWY